MVENQLDQETLSSWAYSWFEGHNLGLFELVEDDPLKELNGDYYRAVCKICERAISITKDSPHVIRGDDCLSDKDIANHNKTMREVNSKLQGHDLGNLDSLDRADLARCKHVVSEILKTDDPDIINCLRKIDVEQFEALFEALSIVYIKKSAGISHVSNKVSKKGSPREWRGYEVNFESRFIEDRGTEMITKAVVVIPNGSIRIFYKYNNQNDDELSLYGLVNAEQNEIRTVVSLIAPFKKLVFGNRGKGRSSRSQYESYVARAIAGEPVSHLAEEAATEFGIEVESARRGIDRRVKKDV